MLWLDYLLEKKPALDLLLTLAGLLVALLLGIMAIVLSGAANRIADAQLKLTERQTALAEVQLQPKFRFETGYHSPLPSTEGTSRESIEVLRIFNDGAPIEDFWLEQRSFLEVTRWTPSSQGNPEEKRLFPTYYFGNREFTKAPSGLLCTLESAWGPPSFGSPTRNAMTSLFSIKDSLGALDPGITNAWVRTFITLAYSDVMGESHSIVYELNPNVAWFGPSTPRRLDDSRIRALWKAFVINASEKPLIELSAEEILEAWNNLPKSEELDQPPMTNKGE